MTIKAIAFEDNAEFVAELLKQLANKYRLMILCSLIEQELCVGQLNEKIDLSQSALSQHLAKLRDNHLVATRRQSQTIYYHVADEKVKAILKVLHSHFCD